MSERQSERQNLGDYDLPRPFRTSCQMSYV